MTALDRATLDESRGDLASARARLASYLRTRGSRGEYDPAIIERLARLCARMGDPTAAGQWYFLIDSHDDAASAAIERFNSSRGKSTFQLWIALPPWARSLPLTTYPAPARERLARIIPPHLKAQQRVRALKPRGLTRAMGVAFSLGCTAVIAVAVALLIVGTVTVVKWASR